MILELNSRRSLSKLLCNEFPNGVGCEVGVMAGDHAKILLGHGKPKILYLIDLWEHQPHLDLCKERFEGANVEFIQEDSATALATFEDDFFDWIYVDADHLYDSVKRDLKAALPKIKNGGILCGHDFKVVRRFGTGVVRAVLEFIQDGHGHMVGITNDNLASWAIKVTK